MDSSKIHKDACPSTGTAGSIPIFQIFDDSKIGGVNRKCYTVGHIRRL